MRNGLRYVYTGNVHDACRWQHLVPRLRRAADRARLVRTRSLGTYGGRLLRDVRREVAWRVRGQAGHLGIQAPAGEPAPRLTARRRARALLLCPGKVRDSTFAVDGGDDDQCGLRIPDAVSV